MAADEFCSGLQIPARLHTGERQPIPEFASSELIYHRTPPDTQLNGRIPAAVFKVTRLPGKSFDRSSLCQAPEDVLYNSRSQDAGRHFTTWGVISIPIGALRAVHYEHPAFPAEPFTCDVEHKPERCKFPHSQLLILRAGIARTDNLPDLAKSELRAALAEISAIQKMPGVLSILE